MPKFFRISVAFHDARFHGQGDGGAPEWPPSPLRIYQAVVAACARRVSIDQARTALLWFEQQSKPTIVAPAASASLPYRIAVPNNDLDMPAGYWAKGQEAPKYKKPQDLKAMKTISPAHFNGGDTIHYLYPIPETPSADVSTHIELLSEASRSITHVGWGVDMVAAQGDVVTEDVATGLIGRRWSPANDAMTWLRVPQSGVLEALIQRHDAFLRRITEDGYMPVPPLTGYGKVAYDDTERVNHRPFAAFDLVPVDPGDHRLRKPFRQEDAVRVAAMLRHAAWDAAKNDPGDWRTNEWAEQFVAGHGPHKASESFPRFSYIPLPTIGPSHADGMIRRALIAETSDGDGRSAVWARRRLAGLTLRDEGDGKEVAFLKSASPDADGVFRAYCDSSDHWQTVTPVILPGFDDNNRAKRLKLLLRCFEQIGIPLDLIADLDVQKSPWLRASAQTRAYKRSERLLHLPACHVRVYFKNRVAGPLVIGAGRHRGLGLFAAMEH